ncbi:MAG TPA: polymer-forming cytoskeletal protein [Pseudolabrys sp.]|nr:polymer-forming cytoskeletal protein [Pseudolabrys sp.]
MSYFKGDNKKIYAGTGDVVSLDGAGALNQSHDAVSTLGRGMLVTGNIVCDGTLQIHGRVMGDIHAAQLVICEGAQVEGKVVAQEAVVHGGFKGTIHGNSVRLQGSAMVDGEIFNKSLTVEENVQFEGMSRRLDKPVDAPMSARIRDEKPALVPNSEPAN